MATISSVISDGSPGKDSLVISYSATKNTNPGSYYDEREEYNFQWEFSVDSFTAYGSDTSGKTTLNYSQCVPSSTTSESKTVSVKLTYEYRFGKEDWVEYNTGKVGFLEDKGNSFKETDGDYREVYTFYGTSGKDPIFYNYKISYQHWEMKWTEPITNTLNSNLSFYPHQTYFTFNNCFSGQQWQVDKGLNSLITNIQEFQNYATQWKSWKNQSPQAACPSFFASNILTAAQLNSVYAYVKGASPWNAGDVVSAAMFNDLATTINN